MFDGIGRPRRSLLSCFYVQLCDQPRQLCHVGKRGRAGLRQHLRRVARFVAQHPHPGRHAGLHARQAVFHDHAPRRRCAQRMRREQEQVRRRFPARHLGSAENPPGEARQQAGQLQDVADDLQRQRRRRSPTRSRIRRAVRPGRRSRAPACAPTLRSSRSRRGVKPRLTMSRNFVCFGASMLIMRARATPRSRRGCRRC